MDTMKNLLLILAMISASHSYGQIDTLSATDTTSALVLRRAPLTPRSTTTEYKAKVVSTNFTIPIIRFNVIDPAKVRTSDKLGNVSFFNSIGAGIGYYFGRLTETTDDKGEVINTELNNTFGIQTGFLFAANSNSSSQNNIFAFNISMSLLNFQVGYGYELGTVGTNEKRGFMTLAYGIPLYKLAKGGFYTVAKSSVEQDEEAGFSKD